MNIQRSSPKEQVSRGFQNVNIPCFGIYIILIFQTPNSLPILSVFKLWFLL